MKKLSYLNLTSFIGIFIVASNLIFILSCLSEYKYASILANYFSLPAVLFGYLYTYNHQVSVIVILAFNIIPPLLSIIFGIGIIFRIKISRHLFVSYQILNLLMAAYIGYIWLGFIRFWEFQSSTKVNILLFILVFITIFFLPLFYIIILGRKNK